jgi:predicted Zn-dependent peptidase
MLERGAGGRDSRAFNDELDRIGVIREIAVRPSMTRLSASIRSEHLDRTLELLTDMVRRPALPEDAIEPVRSLCLQSIHGILDDPPTRALIHLYRRAIPPPLNRSSYGSAEVIEKTTLDEIRDAWAARFRPKGMIIAVAGAVDAGSTADHMNRLLDGWEGAPPPPPPRSEPLGGDEHLQHPSAQIHLEMSHTAPLIDTPEELPFLAAIRALGGGTSSRLFSSVRERHSLCYDVHAGYRPSKHYGICTIGVGTTPERVEKTLSCIREELERFGAEGLLREEFDRVRRALKTHLMMHGESTSARATAIAMDQHQRAHVRTLSDMAASIEQLTFEEVDSVARQSMTPKWISDAVRVAVGPCSPFES